MKALFFKRRSLKFIAIFCFFTLTFQIAFPLASYALTSGPSQPEMQSFEPVGTTDMVNLFTGDFNYNIPLLDVEGYPVNISYHAGVTMDQEASWVGLGWNINPGNINHIVRGVSDDFKGEKIEKTLGVEQEVSNTFGLFAGAEFAGLDGSKYGEKAVAATNSLKGVSPGRMSFNLNFNNYSGISASIGKTSSAQFNIPRISVGVNLGVTQTVSTDKGVDIDYSVTASNAAREVSKDMNYSASIGGGLNSREGMKYWNFGASANTSVSQIVNSITGHNVSGVNKTFVPTGLQTYIPVITNNTYVSSSFVQLKVGGEVYMTYPYGGGTYTTNTVSVDLDGTKSAYGYFHLDKASKYDIVDFSRDKDGRINKKTKYLPTSSLTYDIFSINGQGTGGSFRPYRNDYGTTFDPAMRGDQLNESHLVEVGVGNTFEVGYDYKTARTRSSSGPWEQHHRKFTGKSEYSKHYEPVYMKQAGELTSRNEELFNRLGKSGVLSYEEARDILNNNNDLPNKDSRTPRANLLYFLTAEEASQSHISLLPNLLSYDSDGFKNASDWTDPYQNPIDRFGSNGAKSYHASEFVQITPSGQRYIYGLPVMNKYQTDCEVSISTTTNEYDDIATGIGWYGNLDIPNPSTNSNVPKFSSKTTTPSYAHSYMLTSVLSSDYTDLTGDGITDDDLGSYTKFNYSKKNDYNWRVPYSQGTGQKRHGLKSDCKDDRATFSGGVRETWMLHSIESKNYVAEFYTSQRQDAQGARDADFLNTNYTYSYKLDSIVLFNKNDRKLNGTGAKRIKTVIFSYDYSLSQAVPNSLAGGKLTLKAIYMRDGESKIGYLSPYKFNYSSKNPDYDTDSKDCWGYYKNDEGNKILGSSPNGNLDLSNLRYPYVNQNDDALDENSSAWNLEEIILPSGGSIKVTYEADDYAYVQDKQAMEMFKVAGTGPTADFIAKNSLYQSAQDPYLYIYFKRRVSEEHGATIAETYLKDVDLLQFTFDINISQGVSNTCGFPLTESVKGYARVAESGVCSNNPDYAYVKVEPKTPNNLPALNSIDVKGARLNPITVAGINFARYNNTKALIPTSDLPSGSDAKAIIKSLKASFGEYINFFQNPLKTFVKKGKAKTYQLDKSYIRLVSPGLKKKGGGHRVKKLEFFDTWEGNSSVATYGSEYIYTTNDDYTGHDISSGVATYEPLFGGDENPMRVLFNTESFGNDSKFPPADPIEVMQEAPFGELFFPPASVGYRKVRVKSIHQDQGASSQTVQEHEFYTAYDFPVRVHNAGKLKVVEDRRPKLYDFLKKKDIYRVAQGYTLEFNDMHGKPKKNSVYVISYDPNNSSVEEYGKPVSFTEYKYFEDGGKVLQNDNIPCVDFVDGVSQPKIVMKTMGEDVDVAFDTREKKEQTDFFEINVSTNGFLAPPLPVAIPVGFPKFNTQTNIFSSFVCTKIVQKYGIVKSVSTFNKGALIKAEHTAFDVNTGQPLITTVNTEHGDREHTIKYPAYWAYKNMGMAYENIHIEDKTTNPSIVKDSKAYLVVDDLGAYNIGDELELTYNEACNTSLNGKRFKVWVVGKKTTPTQLIPYDCNTSTCVSAANPIRYVSSAQDGCFTETEIRDRLYAITNNSDVYNIPSPFEEVKITLHHKSSPIKGCEIQDFRGPGCRQYAKPDVPVASGPMHYETYRARTHPIYYNNSVLPWYSQWKNTLKLVGEIEIEQKTSTTSYYYNAPDCNTISNYEIEVTTPSNSSSLPSVASCSLYAQNYYSDYVNQAYLKDYREVTLRWDCRRASIFDLYGQLRYSLEASSNNYKRGVYPLKQPMTLVVMPYKVGATAINDNNVSWPVDEQFKSADIKVIRSGKRNMLTETVQEITVLDTKETSPNTTPYFSKTQAAYNKYFNNWPWVINATAKTFTDEASVPNSIHSDYINPYVTGAKGNYRVSSVFAPHKQRTDNALGTGEAFTSDRFKGLYELSSMWDFQATNYNDEYFGKMVSNTNSGNWKMSSMYQYSTWGKQVQVVDALYHNNIILYGFDNKVPVATVANASLSSSLYENFEDVEDLHTYQASPLAFNNNPVKDWVVNDLNSSTFIGANSKLLRNTDRHTGNNALQFTSTTNIPIPISLGMSYIDLVPFYFTTDQDYVVSCWQKVTANGTAPPNVSTLRVTYGANVAFLYAKTPPIDGWVLYEGEVSIPSQYNSQNANLSFAANTIVDDLRIFPTNGNMKSYVYDRVHRRVVASLDENHMATFFEYNDQGKLVRVKRETEKGILTIKESRESLKKTTN